MCHKPATIDKHVPHAHPSKMLNCDVFWKDEQTMGWIMSTVDIFWLTDSFKILTPTYTSEQCNEEKWLAQ